MSLGASAMPLCKSSHDFTVDSVSLCPGLQLKQSHVHNKKKTAPWNEIIDGVQTKLFGSLDVSWTHCFIFQMVQFVLTKANLTRTTNCKQKSCKKCCSIIGQTVGRVKSQIPHKSQPTSWSISWVLSCCSWFEHMNAWLKKKTYAKYFSYASVS